jgi:Mg-chelatase subunit ChlD
MVRVTAEEQGSSKPSQRRRVGVDIVAVLDISGSMTGDKLERMKDAMANVISKLGSDDRLSIVSFESSASRLTELTYMSDQGRVAARDKIKELFTKGGTNMGPALHEGAEVHHG